MFSSPHVVAYLTYRILLTAKLDQFLKIGLDTISTLAPLDSIIEQTRQVYGPAAAVGSFTSVLNSNLCNIIPLQRIFSQNWSKFILSRELRIFQYKARALQIFLTKA